MSLFSEQYKGQNLSSMHNTNPESFTQVELEETIGQPFNNILQNVSLGFAADAGTVALRQTMADFHYECITSDEVITHAGAQEALFCAFSALLQAGDRVLVVTPIFEPLLQIPINIGCVLRSVNLDVNNNWSLNLDDVEAEFKLGCRLFVINFPHNPTGATLTETELKHLINLCKKYDVWLLSDEVFRGLEHVEQYRLPAVADIYKKGISIGVISKAFAVPGIRIGWLVCRHEKLRTRIIDIKGYLSICNSQIDELLASVILKKPEKLLERNIKIILKNKMLLMNIKSIENHNVEMFVPNAGCCVFAILKHKKSDIINLQAKEKIEACYLNGSQALVNTLAKESGYLLYPSSLFKTKVQAVRIGFGSRDFIGFLKKINGENYDKK